MLSHDALGVLIGLLKLIFYTGYVLLAGTLTFWVLVWPEGRRDAKLRGLAGLGTALLAIGTVLGPPAEVALRGQSWTTALQTLPMAAAAVRMFALAAAVLLLWRVRHHPMTGAARATAVAVVVVVAGTLVAGSNAVGGSWQLVKLVATGGHVLAASAWLGGLVALATVLIPREFLEELDVLIPKFSLVATVSIVVLAVTGVLHALAVSHGIRPLLDSRYGLVLAIKVAVFGLMLLLGNHGRTYAARAAFRASHSRSPGELRASTGVHLLAVVMGAELAVAFVALGLTALLVMVAPHP